MLSARKMRVRSELQSYTIIINLYRLLTHICPGCVIENGLQEQVYRDPQTSECKFNNTQLTSQINPSGVTSSPNLETGVICDLLRPWRSGVNQHRRTSELRDVLPACDDAPPLRFR